MISQMNIVTILSKTKKIKGCDVPTVDCDGVVGITSEKTSDM